MEECGEGHEPAIKKLGIEAVLFAKSWVMCCSFRYFVELNWTPYSH